jgi:hypothetical protein
MINQEAFWSVDLAQVPFHSIILFFFFPQLKNYSTCVYLSQAALDVPPRRVARRCLNVTPQSAGRRPGQQHRWPGQQQRPRGRGWRTPPRGSHHTVGEPLRRPAPASQPQVLSQGLKGMEEDAFFPTYPIEVFAYDLVNRKKYQRTNVGTHF